MKNYCDSKKKPFLQYFLLVPIILSLLPVVALADTAGVVDSCEIELGDLFTPSNISYNVFASSETERVFRFRITNRSGKRCRLRLTLDSRGVNLLQSTSNSLRYVFRAPNGRRIGPSIESRDSLDISIPASSKSIDVQFAMVIEAGQIVPAGIYQQQVEAVLFERGSSASNRIVASRKFSAKAAVGSQAGLSLAGTAGVGYSGGQQNAVMDFGTLQTGKKRRVYLHVRSNQPYQVRFTSRNRWRLRNLELQKYYIDYRAYLQGSLINTADGSPAHVRMRSATPARGRPFEFTVEIGDVTRKAAGTYQDVITMDVLPIE